MRWRFGREFQQSAAAVAWDQLSGAESSDPTGPVWRPDCWRWLPASSCRWSTLCFTSSISLCTFVSLYRFYDFVFPLHNIIQTHKSAPYKSTVLNEIKKSKSFTKHTRGKLTQVWLLFVLGWVFHPQSKTHDIQSTVGICVLVLGTSSTVLVSTYYILHRTSGQRPVRRPSGE